MSTEHVTIVTAIAVFALYVMLNFWKFKKPQTELGRALLMLAMQATVFSLKAWGFRNPKVPFTSAIESLEKQIDELEEKK